MRVHVSVPGREAHGLVLADGADTVRGQELARRVGCGARGDDAAPVVVEVRVEPRAVVVARVGENPARAQLANASRARHRRHEAVGSAHQAVAAVEHGGAAGDRVGVARGVDRLQAPAAREHLRGRLDAGEVLEAAHLGAVGERIEPVRAVGQAQAPDGAVDVDLLHQQLDGIVRPRAGRRIARRVDLEYLHDAPAGDARAPLVVVDLEGPVVQEEAADLVAHVPFERQDGCGHVARLVGRREPVLPRMASAMSENTDSGSTPDSNVMYGWAWYCPASVPSKAETAAAISRGL